MIEPIRISNEKRFKITNTSKIKKFFQKETVSKFINNKPALIGTIVILIEIILIVFIPTILNLNPTESDALAFNAQPSVKHILGTDEVGRDLFARLIYGGRVSLFVGFVSAIISALIGLPLGLLAGYFGGAFEVVVMRLVDIFMSFPEMLLVLVFVSVFGQSIPMVTFVIGLLGWTQFARLIYGNVLSVRSMEYVQAAKAIGSKNHTIMFKYILPNSIAPVWIALTFRIASAILLESALSFLGMGVQPPSASWGNLIYAAQNLTILTSRVWMWVPAGICLIITIVSINFLGDGIRDALDPKTKE